MRKGVIKQLTDLHIQNDLDRENKHISEYRKKETMKYKCQQLNEEKRLIQTDLQIRNETRAASGPEWIKAIVKASCVLAGPGRALLMARSSVKRRSESHCFLVTNLSSRRPIWAWQIDRAE